MRLPWLARFGLRCLVGASLAILYGPLLFTVMSSVVPLKAGRPDWSTVTFAWYARLADNGEVLEALTNTLIVGVGAVAASLVLGTIFAFHYHFGRGAGREIHQFLIFVPFLMPPIVTGIALLIFFREIGLSRSLLTVTIGHTAMVLALVYRTLLQRLQTLSPSLIEASFDLGAGRLQTFRRILLPQLASAAAAGAMLAFALSFDETLITLMVTGTDNTLPLRLWAMMRTGFTPDINALVTLILAGSTVLCLAVARLIRP